MTILLDIDGVLVTTPSWQKPEFLSDGFMKFNDSSAKNLAFILDKTKASIVLTTTHRTNHSIDNWKTLLANRGIVTSEITIINNKTSLTEFSDRLTEIKEWVHLYGDHNKYVIIDDDSSLQDLPMAIKSNWVKTSPLIGLDDEATDKVMAILITN